MNVIESKRKIIDPDQPLPKLVMKVGTLISAINAKNIEAIGSVAYVPIANNEFAFTRFSYLLIQGQQTLVMVVSSKRIFQLKN
jgi:hypothetical protein